ncbi:MAG: hypothetical protein AB8I08_26490 [Sandaracinaceae bacterium]
MGRAGGRERPGFETAGAGVLPAARLAGAGFEGRGGGTETGRAEMGRFFGGGTESRRGFALDMPVGGGD